MRHCIRLAFCLTAAVLISCLSDGENSNNPIPYAYRGHFAIGVPGADTGVSIDGGLMINWKTHAKRASGHVSIFLQSEMGSILLASDVPDTGGYRADIRDMRLPRAAAFRVKVMDARDTSLFDYCAPFGINPSPEFRIYFKSIGRSTIFMLDSLQTITLDLPPGEKPALNVELLKGDGRVGILDETILDSALTWKVKSRIGSGKDYRLEILCLSDSPCPYHGLSEPFSIASRYHGGFDVEIPGAEDTLAAGDSVTVRWTNRGNPGLAGAIGLYRGDKNIRNFDVDTGFQGDSGSRELKIPVGLESFSDYRFGIFSASDRALAISYSRPFSIKGVDPDSAENDDTRATARPILVGEAPQRHTLPPIVDVDWFWFNAEAGKRYAILVKGLVYVKTAVHGPGISSSGQWVAAPVNLTSPRQSGRLDIEVLQHWRESPYLEYFISLHEVLADSSGAFAGFAAGFSAPISGQEIQKGITTTITWKPDTTVFDSAITLQLFEGGAFVRELGAGIPNRGVFAWNVSLDLPPSTRYQIRMSSSAEVVYPVPNPYLWGVGPRFSLVNPSLGPGQP